MSTAEAQRNWRASHGARTGIRGRAATAPCGTLAAHKRHVRHRDSPCELCRLAARADRGFRRNSAVWQRSDRSAWLLHRAALDELLASPKRVAASVRAQLRTQRSGAGAEPLLWARWEQLLDGPLLDLASVMVGLDDDAKQLRSMTPFVGIIDDQRASAPVNSRETNPETSRRTSRWRSSTPPPNWCEHTGPTDGVVELPFHLYWSDDNNRFDLSKRSRLRSMYQTVLTEGSAQDVRDHLNLSLLLDLWDELWLSPAVHEAWDGWVEGRRHGTV
jgi:hypothetical protein